MLELRFAMTQQQKSVTGSHLYRDNWLRHCYTGSIGWRIIGPSVLSNTESTLLWVDDKDSSPCLMTEVPIDPGIQKAWIILHSIIQIHTY